MRVFMIVIIGSLVFGMCGSRATEDAKTALTGEGWDVTISGKVATPQAGKIYVTELRPDRPGKKDSIDLKSDHTYSKTVHLSEPGYYTLNFYGRQLMNIILYKSNVTVNVDGTSQESRAEVLGSPDQDIVMHVQQLMVEAQNSPEIKKITDEFTAAGQANNEAKQLELQKQYITLNKLGTDKVAAYLMKQPASLAVVEVLGQGNALSREDYFSVYADAAAKLQKEMPNSVFVKPFLDEFEKSKATAIGSVAPEITNPDPSGKVIKLSSLRGKYVLVDFWAKWCAPCRRENPNIVKAYHQFKAKGFEVFGVSLDRDKGDWAQAIKDDGLVWTQVLDVESKAAMDYSVKAIPFSILVDPKGVIIAKNLRGGLLEQKLMEVLK